MDPHHSPARFGYCELAASADGVYQPTRIAKQEEQPPSGKYNPVKMENEEKVESDSDSSSVEREEEEEEEEQQQRGQREECPTTNNNNGRELQPPLFPLHLSLQSAAAGGETITSNDGNWTVTFKPKWADLPSARQTLYPVWRDSIQILAPPTPHKGSPAPNQDYTLRATKNVILHPGFGLSITHTTTGQPHQEADISIRLSLVGEDYKRLPRGSCPCETYGVLKEPKPTYLDENLIATVHNGQLDLTKLQIGCVSGHRGHGALMRVKVDLLSPPLQGKTVYSLPIEVGAKSPFSVIYVTKAKEQPVGLGSGGVYSGYEEMTDLLERYSLSKFHELFVNNEIDPLAFGVLTETELSAMGIQNVEDRVTIMRSVHRYNLDKPSTSSTTGDGMPSSPMQISSPTPAATSTITTRAKSRGSKAITSKSKSKAKETASIITSAVPPPLLGSVSDPGHLSSSATIDPLLLGGFGGESLRKTS